MADQVSELQGKWRVSALEVNGAPMPKDQIASSSITIVGNRFTATGPGSLVEGDMTVETSARPKRFSVRFVRGTTVRITNAIYEVKGSTLRICLNENTGPAPTSFTTKQGDGGVLQTLTREG